MPLTSLVDEYIISKERLQSMLSESRDTVIQDNPPDLNTGRMWEVTEVMRQLDEMTQHAEVHGVMIDGRAAVGFIKREQFWSESSEQEHRKLHDQQVRQLENERHLCHAAQQAQQYQWLNWDDIEKLELKWSDRWRVSAGHLQALIRTAYDVHLSPPISKQWGIQESQQCPLCGKYGSLKNMLSACSKALQSGWYTFGHNFVLNVVASAAREGQVPELSLRKIAFVKQGVRPNRQRPRQAEDRKWELFVDKPLPESIVVSALRFW
ncbi:Hypothetical predicted protein [Octopus vulgaris]|uniref:Reverse transcriptase zinc-binding domain-containing protein n=1 Tax=Octopus vulgaris TaxID=6645 RepID=A0AA36B0P5_OCTVU|nr:Hypothetical predicted protein [Octopus vulgaris]